MKRFQVGEVVEWEMITYQGEKLQTIRSAYTIGNYIKEAFQHTINGGRKFIA